MSLLLRLSHFIYPSAVVRNLCPKQSVLGKPQILLLGWGGSVPRNLKKLEDFYSVGKELSVCSFIMPLWSPGFIRQTLIDDLISKLEQNNNSSKLFVHSYSNNGAWVLAELLQKQIKVDKLIIDSAPWFVYTKPSITHEAALLTKVATSVLTNGKTQHFIISPLVQFGLVMFCTTSRLLEWIQKLFFSPSFQPLVKDLVALSCYLRDEIPINLPILFIFTTQDALIPPSIIRDFISLLSKRRGNNKIESLEFAIGGHTSAFFLHGQEYKARISNFFQI